MDPALQEILKRAKRDDEEVEAIIRLDQPEANIPGVRIISRFGMIATCRLKKKNIKDTHAHENVVSLKAARLIGPEPTIDFETSASIDRIETDTRRSAQFAFTGKGVIVACLDWGVDFTNPCFRHANGNTRIIALWDQRGKGNQAQPSKYGYGTIHTQDEINNALQSEKPFAVLGYHPGSSDPRGTGSHGTHVLDIAAGNGRHGGPIGVAPEADLIFVHLADRNTDGLANLGDSVRILEAVDFVSSLAGQRPWVINQSIGRHGGPHNGSTLCEMAFDYLLSAAPNRFIVQSAGNYFNKFIHASGVLRQDQPVTLEIEVNDNDTTENELEIWTKDELTIRLLCPEGIESEWIEINSYGEIKSGSDVLARIYNRKLDPNNGDNHIDIFFQPLPGKWRVQLVATKIVDGNFHAWIERDDACAGCQARFVHSQATGLSTTGTLANGRIPLVIGAYNAHEGERVVASFSSAGPTRDGRLKPDLVAPGVSILAARSTPPGAESFQGSLIRKSGTSMATPHITGTVALCMQAANKPLWWNEIRRLILETVESTSMHDRYGAGYLQLEKAVQAASDDKSSISPDKKNINLFNIQSMKTDSPYPLDPDKIFRMISCSKKIQTLNEGEPAFDILARPGEKITQGVREGDLLVRVSIGEPGMGHVFRISSSRTFAPADLISSIRCESRRPGTYVLVDDLDGSTIARKFLNRFDQLDNQQLLLRYRERAADQLGFEKVAQPNGQEAEPPGLINITHAGPYRIAYDRLTNPPEIEPLPRRETRIFRGTVALQDALNNWASYIEKVMPSPAYILTGGLYTDKPGEHGVGSAIDVDGFWWSDSDKFLAVNAPTDWFRYLTIEATMRKVFGTVLNYDYNKKHHDHWHCDLGGSTRWRAVRSQILFAQRALNVIWGENLNVNGKWDAACDAVCKKNGYDFAASDGWDRFLSDLLNRQSSEEVQVYSHPKEESVSSEATDITKVPNWTDLICFDPPASIKTELASRNMSIQYLRDANYLSDLNLDYYGVYIGRLPFYTAGRQMTAPELLLYIRTHLNQFIDSSYATFRPYSDPLDKPRWESANPFGAVVFIDVWGPDNAAVVVSKANDRRWTFTTIATPDTGTHPVSGNREFGLIDSISGGQVFFTRGADRTTGAIETVAGVAGFGKTNPFMAADGLWKSLITKVNKFVNTYGGAAFLMPTDQNLYDWNQTKFYMTSVLKIKC